MRCRRCGGPVDASLVTAVGRLERAGVSVRAPYCHACSGMTSEDLALANSLSDAAIEAQVALGGGDPVAAIGWLMGMANATIWRASHIAGEAGEQRTAAMLRGACELLADPARLLAAITPPV